MSSLSINASRGDLSNATDWPYEDHVPKRDFAFLTDSISSLGIGQEVRDRPRKIVPESDRRQRLPFRRYLSPASLGA